MRRRLVAVALTATLASTGAGVAAHPTFSLAAPVDAPTDAPVDPDLQAAVDAALDAHSAGAPLPTLTVEVLTPDPGTVAAQVRALGGVVTGSVPGEVVQAILPANQIDSLAATAPADVVRLPELVNRLEPTPEAGTGAVVGEQVGVMNAAAWYDAGLRGSGVRVGIVDFFDMSYWNPAEHGPEPTVGNGRMFCRDSTAYPLCNLDGSINSSSGDMHGVAVAEVVKDVAPDADLFIATAGTLSDLRAAIDWFAANGVHIMTRSLGSPYDGPGDGTGPMAGVVDYASTRGIVWFNSAGNDAFGRYLRVTVPTALGPNGYVDFDPGPGVDTALRIDGDLCVALNGVRWSTDWYLPGGQRTDYRVEVYEPVDPAAVGGTNTNPALQPVPLKVIDTDQRQFPPLEGANEFWCPSFDNYSMVTYLRVKRNASTPVGSAPDVLEISVALGSLERWSVGGSAAKTAVDSANASFVAVGAVHPNPGTTIANYSSQGPTNDGRIKPDMTATACVQSTIYDICFAGTSAASPAAAGMAALLLGAGLAVPGAPLAALTKQLVTDLGPPGRDNAFGTGRALLPAPPTAVTQGTNRYDPLAAPVRVLDTRPASRVGPASLTGPHQRFALIDLPLPSDVVPIGATAVVLNVTSVGAAVPEFVQALPTLRSTIGASSTLNITSTGQIRANMAIVPVGENRSVTLFLPTGGDVVVDLSGSFVPATGPITAGRLVPVEPVRVLDTRPGEPGPTPAGWTPHRPAAGETVRVELPDTVAVPREQIAALVVNVIAVEPVGAGWLRAAPTGGAASTTSTVNYTAQSTVAGHAIVPVGPDGSIGITTFASSHIVVDLEGYITSAAAPAGTAGMFVPVTPARAYDSRGAPNTVHAAGTTRAVQITGLATPAIPAGAGAVSMNLTLDQAAGPGFVTVYAQGGQMPLASNLNVVDSRPIANAAIIGLPPSGMLDVFVQMATHVIIDVNGYFTGTS